LRSLGKIFVIAGSIISVASALGLMQVLVPRHQLYLQGAYFVLGIFLIIVGTYVWASTRKSDTFWDYVKHNKA
jgi:multisubunit Na+/H+ antiporter MnhG subunit